MAVAKIAITLLMLLAVSVPLLAVSGGGYNPPTPTLAAPTPTPRATPTPTAFASPSPSARATPSPAVERFNYGGKLLACGDLPTLQERVLCRLTYIQSNGEQRSIFYVPEECRVLQPAGREACFREYDGFQQCRFGDAKARDACIKRRIGYSKGDLAKTIRLAKFKLYDLEYKAEELLFEKDADESAVISFISKIEERKAEFNSANTPREKSRVLRTAKKDFLDFIDSVKDALK